MIKQEHQAEDMLICHKEITNSDLMSCVDMSAPMSSEHELDMDLTPCAMAGLLADTTVEVCSPGVSDSLTNGGCYGDLFKSKSLFSTLDEVILGQSHVNVSFPPLLNESEQQPSPFACDSGAKPFSRLPTLFADEAQATPMKPAAASQPDETLSFSPSVFYGVSPEPDTNAASDGSPVRIDYTSSSPSSEDQSGLEDSCDTLDFGTVDSSLVFDMSQPLKFSPEIQPSLGLRVPTSITLLPGKMDSFFPPHCGSLLDRTTNFA